MSLRLATFNIENLMSRFDFSGFRNQLKQDRVLRLFDVRSEAEYQRLEEARTIAHTDDTRQMSALAIADCDADILCLQEADNMAALQAFEYGYLFRMAGNGYRQKYLVEGNDSRGIDVAVLMREETRDGQKIECLEVKSHAALTYEDLDLFNDELALTNRPRDRIFKRDCLEVDVRIGGRPLTLYVVHLKSMGPAREGLDGRQATMAVRIAEVKAVRHIIERRFGRGHTADKVFAICGDMNDYQEKVRCWATGATAMNSCRMRRRPARSTSSATTVLSKIPICAGRSSTDGRSSTAGGRKIGISASSTISGCRRSWRAATRPGCLKSSVPDSPIHDLSRGQEVERYPRTGWDRPKASDHCPVVMTLDI